MTNETNIIDDNDKSSPAEIKELWPYYTHGASKAWLKMVDCYITGKNIELNQLNFNEKLKVYNGILKSIEENWIHTGGHAMFQHLDAIFGNKYAILSMPGLSIIGKDQVAI